jgi:hypothetical protein
MPYRGLWAVRREGEPEPLSTHRNQEQAEDAARKTPRVTAVVLHSEDGQLRDLDLDLDLA